MLLHPINNDLIRIKLPSITTKFEENKIKDTDGCIVLTKIDLLQRAQRYVSIEIFLQQKRFERFICRCFMQAIRLKPRTTVYWSSLAQCLYIQARYNADDQHMLMSALEYLRIAVSLKPTNHLLWNALGVVAAHPSELKYLIQRRQHKFIR